MPACPVSRPQPCIRGREQPHGSLWRDQPDTASPGHRPTRATGGHTPAATGRSLPDASSDRRSRQRRLLGLGHPLLGHSAAAAQPLQRQERKRSQSAAARVVDSAASRYLLTVRESGAPSLASHARSPGRRARRMPWESFAVGGPDEAREFWTAAVSDARALPPGGRDGLGGDAGARARARAVAADPSRGRDDRPL